MYDSVFDKEDRVDGTSPMSKKYINRYVKKRELLGVEPLSKAGMSIDGLPGKSSFGMCLAQAKGFIFNNIVKVDI